MRLVLIALILAGLPAAAQAPPDLVKSMVDIESQSVTGFPIGAWVKVKDAKGVELTFTVTEKIHGKDGWQVTLSVTSSVPGTKPVPVTKPLGSTAHLSAEPPVKVSDESVTVGGKPIACKVFTFANGHRKWMSPTIPAGGVVKLVGAKGETFITLLASGKP